MVGKREVDLGLGPWVSRDRALRFEALLEDQMVVFYMSGHPLKQLEKPGLQQLAAFPHIVTARGTSVRTAIHQALEAEGLDIEIVCEVAYLSTAISMVRPGLGITVLPLSTLQAAACQGVLHRPVDALNLRRSLGLLQPSGVRPSAATAAFITVLHQQLLNKIYL